MLQNAALPLTASRPFQAKSLRDQWPRKLRAPRNMAGLFRTASLRLPQERQLRSSDCRAARSTQIILVRSPSRSQGIGVVATNPGSIPRSQAASRAVDRVVRRGEGAVCDWTVLAKFRAQLFHDRFGAASFVAVDFQRLESGKQIAALHRRQSQWKIVDPIDLLHCAQFSQFDSVRPVAPARASSAKLTICKHRSKHNPREITGVRYVANVFAVRRTTEIESLIATFLAMRARFAPIRKRQRHLWFAKSV